MDRQQFQETVWDYYRQHSRDLPWRSEPFSAYNILVSEVMLQQTQVSRVIPKYHAFLADFASCQALAAASLADVLRAWSGLGYNRRAKYLHEAAQQLKDIPEPWTIEDLVACKGIGVNTAAAVVTYTYNQSVPFIETNVRTVYIHHFFEDRTDVTDKELLPYIVDTLDTEHPREWYWALMDYGTHIKASYGNASRYSKHFTKQSKFEGSLRQIRGQILRTLAPGSLTIEEIKKKTPDERLSTALDQLLQEGLICKKESSYSLAD